MLPSKRKPVAGEATGFQMNIDALKIDNSEDSLFLIQLQALRLRNRFIMTPPVARLVASLAYGEAR